MPEVVEQVVARNKMAGPTVLSLDVNGRLSVEWQGSGDPEGRDVQYVPEEIARSVQFRQACERGIIQIEADPAQLLDKQNQAWKTRMEKDAEAVVEKIDNLPDNDFIGLDCVGPGTRVGADCGASVPVRAPEVDTRPPLCDRHIQLSGRYASDHVEEDRTDEHGEVKKVLVTKWRLV